MHLYGDIEMISEHQNYNQCNELATVHFWPKKDDNVSDLNV